MFLIIKKAASTIWNDVYLKSGTPETVIGLNQQKHTTDIYTYKAKDDTKKQYVKDLRIPTKFIWFNTYSDFDIGPHNDYEASG